MIPLECLLERQRGRSKRRCSQAAAGFQRVDVGRRLVCTDTRDPRKAEGVTALMTAAGLDRVESDFEYGIRNDRAIAPMILDCVIEKVLGERCDLDIGQA